MQKIPGFIRDEKTKAVINTNLAEYQKILAERSTGENLNSIKREIDQLKNDINNLKSLVYEYIK